MAVQLKDPIDYILASPISQVLVKGFAEVYQQKPQFPIQFLGKWLKQYSKGQQRRHQLENSKSQKQQKIVFFENQLKQKHKKSCMMKGSQQELRKQHETQFIEKVQSNNYLVDLLDQYLPETVQKNCTDRGVPVTGCYVGELTYRKKKLEENNFQPNAEFDSEAPKIIQYIGASKSHKFMIGQILPNESGRSYEVFKEEEPPAEDGEEGKVVKPKKKYLYVPLVQRDQKMYFFKFPRLGSFACFPLRIKSCLSVQAFDKGIGDYKAFVKSKQQIQKQYSERHSQAKQNYQGAKRKYDQHEGNDDDPTFHAEHVALEEEYKKNQQILKEVEGSPPVIEPFKYETKAKDYVISVDTMGKDVEVSEQILTYLDQKVDYFKEKWEYKEYKMLLEDILQYLQEEHTLENLDNYFKDQERSIVSAYESQIKEQFPNKEKEAEFQLTLIKCSKLLKILQQASYVTSMNAYLHYHLPKFRQIIQIILMLLGHPKEEINLPLSNSLNYRKCIKKPFIEAMLANLQKYQLRRESSQAVAGQYKINKLLQRLQKIDGEAVGKYNAWLYALLIIAKQICWARIQCRDAKIQTYEARVKAKNQRDAEIVKYLEELQKNLQLAKAELTEETLPTFVEQDWRKTYAVENVRPQVLTVDELKLFLDIE